MSAPNSRFERLQDLLADDALQGLDPAEVNELNRLLADDPDAELARDEFALATAAVDVALSADEIASSSMPPALRSRIVAQGQAHLARQRGLRMHAAEFRPTGASGAAATAPAAASSGSIWPWIRGYAIAACIGLFLVFAWSISSNPSPLGPAPLPPSRLYAELSAELGTKVVSWQALDHPRAAGVSGDVVWNNAEQTGVMRFKGLATNNPQQNVYQLWIFDKNRPEQYPVDGGVFDIDAATGDVYVKINPKLKVFDAAAFAITLEPPGGVVVSSRKDLLLLAAVKS